MSQPRLNTCWHLAILATDMSVRNDTIEPTENSILLQDPALLYAVCAAPAGRDCRHWHELC